MFDPQRDWLQLSVRQHPFRTQQTHSKPSVMVGFISLVTAELPVSRSCLQLPLMTLTQKRNQKFWSPEDVTLSRAFFVLTVNLKVDSQLTGTVTLVMTCL